jgi:hypothetical protein
MSCEVLMASMERTAFFGVAPYNLAVTADCPRDGGSKHL